MMDLPSLLGLGTSPTDRVPEAELTTDAGSFGALLAGMLPDVTIAVLGMSAGTGDDDAPVDSGTESKQHPQTQQVPLITLGQFLQVATPTAKPAEPAPTKTPESEPSPIQGTSSPRPAGHERSATIADPTRVDAGDEDEPALTDDTTDVTTKNPTVEFGTTPTTQVPPSSHRQGRSTVAASPAPSKAGDTPIAATTTAVSPPPAPLGAEASMSPTTPDRLAATPPTAPASSTPERTVVDTPPSRTNASTEHRAEKVQPVKSAPTPPVTHLTTAHSEVHHGEQPIQTGTAPRTIDVPRLATRIESIVRHLEGMPPPRAMTIRVDETSGLQITVSVRSDGVHMGVAGARVTDLPWLQGVADTLVEHGFAFGGFSEHRQQRHSDSPTPEPDYQPSWRRLRRKQPPAQGVRL